MMQRLVVCAVVAVACSRGVRKDVTPGIAAQAPEAAAAEAAKTDPPALTPPEMVEHVLSRVTFGPTAQDRKAVQAEGIAAFLEEQLHPERIDDGALDQRLQSFDVLRKG